MEKSQLYKLSLLTLIGFPAVGALILWFVEDQPSSLGFSMPMPLHFQLGIGLLAGTVAGFLAWLIIRLPFMKATRIKYSGLVLPFDLNWSDILFVSLCAGIGEEYFFRGVLQQYWGIWITSIVFVAIHGYLNPKDWRISIYGAFMVLVIAGIGYLNDYVGLVSAMIAHACIDIILFYRMTKDDDENNI